MIIITDTGSDILEQEAQEMDIRLVSITSRFPGRTFTHNTQAEFTAFCIESDCAATIIFEEGVPQKIVMN